MSEAYRRFKSLRRDPDMPIFIRNITNGVVEISFPYEEDFKFWQSHPLKSRSGDLRIPPGRLIDLRYFLSEEPLHTNLLLPWYLRDEKFVVENEPECGSCYYCHPTKCPALKPLYEESRIITRMANDRWRAVMATRSRQ